MKDEYQNAESVGIIGSADGPTSVFIADKRRKKYFPKIKYEQMSCCAGILLLRK